MAEMGIFETIYSTRAMRRFKPDPIPEEVLQKIVEAGTHAPSGGNMQTWGFLLVRDPELKRFIGDLYFNTWKGIQASLDLPADMPPAQARMMKAAMHLAEHLHEVPVILLACALKEYPPLAGGRHPRMSTATMHGSIYLAVQNILLACRALGVGSVLTTLHCFFEDELKQKLGIPDNMEIAALLPMGYPQGKFGPTTRRPVEEVMRWDRWGNTK
ncbi:MAG: nitroreductase family protein [Candidatus Binatia bacterium]